MDGGNAPSVIKKQNQAEMLEEALRNSIWINHNIGDRYTMDSLPDLWEIVYYPIFQDGKTQEFYNEPRALMQNINKKGFWSKEVPLRYLVKSN